MHQNLLFKNTLNFPQNLNQEIIDILELAIINPKVEAKVIFELISAIPSMNARTISQLAITMADFDSNINPNVYGQLISKKLEDMRSSNLKVSTEGLIRIINKYPFFETGLEKTIQSPSLLLHRLGKSIRGQEEVLSALSNHFYQWQLFWDRAKTGFTMKPSSIPLLIGNTGTGKTFTVQKMANILGAGFITIDASRLVTEGYVGSNISTELISQYHNLSDDKKDRIIVFLDEIDKLSSSYNKLDIKGNNVLFELLHILEENSTSGANSYDKFATRTTIDTSNFCFVFAGAFQGLFVPNQSPAHPIGFDRCLNSEAQSGSGDHLEAIIKFGIPREIIGRIGWILHLKPLERDVFRDILLSTEESPLTYYRKLYEIHSSVLHLSEKEIDLVIASAISKNVGARGLRQALQEFLSDRLNILFNL